MLRHSITRSLKVPFHQSSRTITTTAFRMAEGDAGAPRSGGSAQGDAFSKREEANENYYVRQKEQEKLQALREKIKQHQTHLEELDKSVSDQMNATKGQGEQK